MLASQSFSDAASAWKGCLPVMRRSLRDAGSDADGHHSSR